MSVKISDWFFKELQRLAKLKTLYDEDNDEVIETDEDEYSIGITDGYTYLARELIEDIKNTEQDSGLN